MAIEKERKFLVTGWPGNTIPNAFLSKECGGILHHIKQGYLMLQDGKQLRVRITDYENATWAYKVDTEVDDERYEFEKQDRILSETVGKTPMEGNGYQIYRLEEILS